MGYRGLTFQVACSESGFNHNKNTDLIPPEMLVVPTRNNNHHEGGIRKRGGTTKVNETVISGAPRLMGGFDFQLALSSFQVVLGNDGKLYKNPATTIKTGMSTANKPSFEVFGGELFTCDGDTTPQTWDGTAAGTSNITTPSADWSGSNQPFQVIAHGKGSSRRLWFIYGNSVYYSSVGNGKEVSGGTSGKITIDTGDAFGLVGGIEFQDRIFVFSRTKAFLIDDIDTDRTNWGYQQAAWTGGVAHWRVIVKTPNDLLAMTEDGDIYSIVAVNAYGDYKRASLARPAFIDNFIRDNVNLAFIDDFHAVWDPTIRAVFFWVVRNGQTQADTALVYFVDRPPERAWDIHDNQSASSGYGASCSFLVRTSAGAYTVYTGSYNGFIWKLNQASRNDAGSGYYAGFKFPNWIFGNPRIRKHFLRGRAVLATQGNQNLQVNIWVDGEAKEGATVSMAGDGDTLDSFVLDTDVLGEVEFLDNPFKLGYYGKRLQLEFFNSNVDEDYFVSQILVDYKPLKKLPK